MSDILPEIRPLIADEYVMELGPGTPNVAVRGALDELARELPRKAKDGDYALACMAGLWLLHNFLDESHAISQDLDTPEGSYWHAILHRREPDYWNAKYWFRRAPNHPIFADLCKDAAYLAQMVHAPSDAEFLVRQKTWNPAAFVDLCEISGHGANPLTLLCTQIQRREWDLLFRYCHDHAFE
jgi:hypothetical protein